MGKRKINPRKRPLNLADLEKAKNQAVNTAADMAWSIFFTVLRDKEGMGIDDLKRIWSEVNDLSDSISKGYCTVSDLRHILKEESGVRLV